MKKVLRVIFLAAVIICIVPRKVKAEDRAYALFYKLSWNAVDVLFPQDTPPYVVPYWLELIYLSDFAEEDKAAMLFYNLFNNNFEDGITAIPDGVEILHVSLSGGHLILDVNEGIKRYGGTTQERQLVVQLVETAMSIPKVTHFSLYINGKIGELPEGNVINRLPF